MAHEVESMFSVKQTPWHGLGKIVQDAGSSAEAIETAGLNWGVEKKPLFYKVPNASSYRFDSVPEKFANVRSSDNSVLGVVGKTYKPLQNSDAFKFFDDALKAKDLVFETAGSLKGGRYVWILASISSGPIEVVKGDAVKPYFLLTNGHDGMKALSVGFTPIRVVCANTLAAAERNANSQLIKLHHSKQTVSNLEKIKEIISFANGSFEASIEQYRFLASKQVNKGDLERFVKIIFPKNQDTERTKTQEEKIMNDIKRLFETGKGQEIKNVQGSYWALYNATTEYLSYETGRSNDSRMFSLWMGDNKVKSGMALNIATEMARVA